jgi:glycosyltransferase involved in cell wall biosynthesis
MADSPALATELAQMDIHAPVVRLLPLAIEADVEPLPPAFTILSFWWDGRRDFYGGHIVLELAREMPDVQFLIAGATGAGESPSPNVQFLGFQDDLSQTYRRSSLLIRLPEHDSLSAMVLEMLARGRYVIYNRSVDGCHLAADIAQVRSAIQDIRTKPQPNEQGARAVREQFSLDREASCLGQAYDRITDKP